jgi:PAS domain S-box-containing protein
VLNDTAGGIAMTPLHLLLVEDSENDALLILRELEHGEFDVTFERVETERELKAALDGGHHWDLVISDYSLPTFDAPGALLAVRRREIDLPFIIVSGTIGEETAVEAMKAGAQDFIVKGRLTRLVPAVRRELHESRARQARRETERALRVSETRFRRLAESGVIGITVADTSGRILEANEAFLKTIGYSSEELSAGLIESAALTPPEWSHASALARERLRTHGFARPWEKEYLRRDGSRVPVLVAEATLDESQSIGVCLDLSDRKQLEEQLRRAQKMEATGTLAGGVATTTDARADTITLPVPSPAWLRGSETVLLVEDEEQVRAIMRAVLRRYGYNVLEAQNGGEAFLVCEKHAAPIHLLLTDVVMPRMNGREVAERLGPMQPDMRVLYVSGHTEDSIVRRGVLDPGIDFLQKPITPEALGRRVREVLDAPARGG